MPAAGTVVTIHLSHLPADYDLVVYGPPGTPLRPSIASTPPLDVPPLTDAGADLTHTTDTAARRRRSTTCNLQTSLPLVGVSASRGTDPEDIVVVSPGGSGFYTVQVTGYNGATSPEPVHAARRNAHAAAAVRPSTLRTITGTVGPALPTLPTGLNTVFVVNRRQLEGTYGSTRATNVINALTERQRRRSGTSASRTSSSPSIASPTVQNAYTAWNANPGNPALANAVVQAINGVVDSQIRSQPNGAGLKYLVIVGGDQIIPFARLDDFTITSAQRDRLREHLRRRTPTCSRRSTPARCSPTIRTAID